MYPILARVGPFFLYSFTVVMALGILLGLLLTYYLGKRAGIELEHWFDGLLLALIAALVGGRFVFVWANYNYYQENLNEVWMVWRGGLSYHGAFFVGVLAIWVWSYLKKVPIGQLAQLLAPSVVLASAFGWLACWFDGCAYGREASAGLLAADLPNSLGVFALRYRTQFIALIACLIIFSLVMVLRRPTKIGWLPWLALLLLSSSRIAVSLLRGDSIPMLGSIRLDSLVDGTLAVISLGAIAVIIVHNTVQSQKNLSGL